MIEPLAQARAPEQFFGPGVRLSHALARDALRQHDILARRELGQQVVELIDEAELAAPYRRALAIGKSSPHFRPLMTTSPAVGVSSRPAI